MKVSIDPLFDEVPTNPAPAEAQSPSQREREERELEARIYDTLHRLAVLAVD